jgi:hypothetical protein
VPAKDSRLMKTFHTIKPFIVVYAIAVLTLVFTSPKISGYAVGHAMGFPLGVAFCASIIPGIFFLFGKSRNLFFLRFNILFILFLAAYFLYNLFIAMIYKGISP